MQTPSWNNQPVGLPGYFSETAENHAIPGFQKFFKGIEISKIVFNSSMPQPGRIVQGKLQANLIHKYKCKIPNED